LQDLWTNIDNDKHLRRQAFRLWAAISARGDIALLQRVEEPGQLGDDILWARLKRGDKTAITPLLTKIETNEQGYWWQVGRFIWSDDLTLALEKAFQRRGSTIQREWDTSYPSDWVTYELVMRLKPEMAEKMLIEHWEHLRFSPYFVQAALYIATPTSLGLVREALSHCPDAGEMLRHADQHFGVKHVGHPGVTRIEQVEAIVPYLKYLDDLEIHEFWDLCNERGWLDFRRVHLDVRLQGKWREGTLVDESQFFADLDNEIAKSHIGWADVWIDRYLRQGERLENVLNLLGNWLNTHKTLSAIEFAAAVVIHAGERRHLDLLSVHGIEPVEDAEAIVADADFSVRRRSLV
jgi:hypothetical protein